jgi:hypothetical protein
LSVLDLVDKGDACGEAVILEAIVEAALLEAIVEAALLEAIGEAESSLNVKEVQGAGRRIAPFAHRVEARAARHDAGCSPRRGLLATTYSKRMRCCKYFGSTKDLTLGRLEDGRM